MNKIRFFLVKQFKTASALRIGGKQIGGHRCTFWCVPVMLIFGFLYMFYFNEEMVFAPKRLNQLTWYNNPDHWYIILCLFGILSALYLYFVFVHFLLFPVTDEEYKELVDRKLI